MKYKGIVLTGLSLIVFLAPSITWSAIFKVKNSSEFQVRFQDNYRELQRWFLEYVGTFLLSPNFVLAPDFEIPGDADADNLYEFAVTASANGDDMSRRDVEVMQRNEEQVQAYIRNAAGGTGVADELAKLAELRQQGVLSDAEFEAQKAKLIQA